MKYHSNNKRRSITSCKNLDDVTNIKVIEVDTKSIYCLIPFMDRTNNYLNLISVIKSQDYGYL